MILRTPIPLYVGMGRANTNAGSMRNKGLEVTPVSYTHLDVYKRQLPLRAKEVDIPVFRTELPVGIIGIYGIGSIAGCNRFA